MENELFPPVVLCSLPCLIKCLFYLCISHKKGYQSKILACYISFTYNLEMCTIRLCVQLSQLKEEFLQNIKSTTAAFTTTGGKMQASR